MSRALGVVYLAAAGCGFGVGAVDGASIDYDVTRHAGYTQSADGNWSDGQGQRYREKRTLLGSRKSPIGVLIGFRRGLAFTRYGERIEGGRTADYHLTGYYKRLALGLGYTSERGEVEIPYTADQTLAGTAGYHGWYVEPAYALLPPGRLYLAATLALIDGTGTLQLTTNSSPSEAGANGVRPGLRFAIGGIAVGPVTLRVTADLRYLITSETTLVSGGDTTAEAYGGLSTAISLSVVL